MPEELMDTELNTGYIPGPLSYQTYKLTKFMLLRSGAVEDTNYIYTVDTNNDATLIYYLGDNTNIKVPTRIGDNNEYTVKYIAATCYNYNNTLLSVTIPEGIVSIG